MFVLKNGKEYATASTAECVDPKDIKYARIFPTKRGAIAAARAWRWIAEWEVVPVDVKITEVGT